MKIFLVSYGVKNFEDRSHYLIIEKSKEKLMKDLKISDEIMDDTIEVKEIKTDKKKIIDLDKFTIN